MLLLVFTFFELLGDIIRNNAPLVTVGDYLLNLMPSMIYVSAPLGVLIAVLGTFGVLNRTSELTAMKTTGISLYRVVAPVMVIAAILALTLFVFDDLYLPATNRRQEALRMGIKGKPAQTFLRPDRKWIFGEQRPGEPGRIYYYRFFDTDRNQFADLTVFEFDPQTFLLTRRIFASTVTWQPALKRWVFENGWQRTFSGDEVKQYQQFELSTFPELREQPEYFKKEVRLAAEMNIRELEHYIRDLQQSGFDVVRLQRRSLPQVRLSRSSRSSWPSSPFPSPSAWAAAAPSPASPSLSESPSSTGLSPISLKPWATPACSLPPSPPGAPTSSSPSPADISCCALPLNLPPALPIPALFPVRPHSFAGSPPLSRI